VSIIFPRKRVSNMFVGPDCSERVTYRGRSERTVYGNNMRSAPTLMSLSNFADFWPLAVISPD